MFTRCEDVRIASPEDIEGIYRLMVMAHGEAGEHPMDEEKVLSRIIAAVQRQASMIGVIGERGGELKGYIYLTLQEMWYSTDTVLQELSNFIHPDYRRSDFAKQTIAFAKKCADELNVDLMIGVVSNERTTAKCRLYRRQVPFVGEFYCYHPNTGAA